MYQAGKYINRSIIYAFRTKTVIFICETDFVIMDILYINK